MSIQSLFLDIVQILSHFRKLNINGNVLRFLVTFLKLIENYSSLCKSFMILWDFTRC